MNEWRKQQKLTVLQGYTFKKTETQPQRGDLQTSKVKQDNREIKIAFSQLFGSNQHKEFVQNMSSTFDHLSALSQTLISNPSTNNNISEALTEISRLLVADPSTFSSNTLSDVDVDLEAPLVEVLFSIFLLHPFAIDNLTDLERSKLFPIAIRLLQGRSIRSLTTGAEIILRLKSSPSSSSTGQVEKGKTGRQQAKLKASDLNNIARKKDHPILSSYWKDLSQLL